jgi:trk system potassium uptake protein TrkH
MAAGYAGVVAALAAFSLPAARLRVAERVQVNEALVVIALVFVVAGLLNALPFALAGLSPIDALFESVSAVTTTGLSVVAQPEAMPPTFRFARAWCQWYGGLGIVVLSVALFAGHGAAFRRLLDPETGSEDLLATTRAYARRVLLLYCGFTAGGFLALSALGLGPFQAVNFTLAAVSTGGFAPVADSMATLSGPVQGVLLLLGLAGAVSLAAYFRTLRQGPRALLGDPELLALLAASALTTLLLSFLLFSRGEPLAVALADGAMLAVSAQTTTGFTPRDLAAAGSDLLAVLMVAMFIGGSLGSTAGGIKLFRALVLFRLIAWLVQRTAMPAHAVAPHWVGERRLESDEAERILLYILLFVALVVVSWLLFVVNGHPPVGALFDVVSAVGTVGLSAGVTSAELPWGLKLVLCVDMLAGRVEILAILVLLHPWTWFGTRSNP